MSISRKSWMLVGSSWGLLGFTRGIKENDYIYRQDMERYNKDIERYHKDMVLYPTIIFSQPIKPTKFYITGIFRGCVGVLLYLTPVTGPLCMIKELYRAEINIRKLDDEKKSRYYNEIL